MGWIKLLRNINLCDILNKNKINGYLCVAQIKRMKKTNENIACRQKAMESKINFKYS